MNRIAKDIMDEQSPQRLLGVREKFYEVRENTLLSIEKTKVYHFINYYFSIVVVGSLYTCAINITFIM